jgi:hypothetical protein
MSGYVCGVCICTLGRVRNAEEELNKIDEKTFTQGMIVAQKTKKVSASVAVEGERGRGGRRRREKDCPIQPPPHYMSRNEE